jgi:hypothetical protein
VGGIVIWKSTKMKTENGGVMMIMMTANSSIASSAHQTEKVKATIMDAQTEIKDSAVNAITKRLKACKTFYEFLIYIRDTEGLKMVQDNGWFWLEYNGEKIEGTEKERFTSASEIDVLMRLSGLN